MKTQTVAILLWLFTRPVWAADWAMDAGASRLEFVASYQGEPVPGAFRRFNARLTLDPELPENSALHVSVDITSADMGSGELDEGIRTAEWFDIDRFPQAEFHSDQIRQLDNLHYLASGKLSLKGAERDIVVPFVFRAEGLTAVMSGELEMLRSWFHIGSGEWATDDLIGFKVEVKFKVTWSRDD